VSSRELGAEEHGDLGGEEVVVAEEISSVVVVSFSLIPARRASRAASEASGAR
jgi:hypothetical protein